MLLAFTKGSLDSMGNHAEHSSYRERLIAPFFGVRLKLSWLNSDPEGEGKKEI